MKNSNHRCNSARPHDVVLLLILLAAMTSLAGGCKRNTDLQTYSPEETKVGREISSATDTQRKISPLALLLAESTEDASLQEISRQEIDRAETLFKSTLTSKNKFQGKLVRQWGELGWDVTMLGDTHDCYYLISEKPTHRFGRGAFVVRPAARNPVGFQAPHRYYDTHTAAIIRYLFEENDVKYAAWNTVHRKQFDIAHQHYNYFDALTRAFVAVDNSGITVQLHGFAQEKHKGVARKADIIVSDSTKFPTRNAREIAVGLKEGFGKSNVVLYPIEVRALGGTKNAQAEVSRDAGSLGFLHLEMSLSMRERLRENASDRLVFMDSFNQLLKFARQKD